MPPPTIDWQAFSLQLITTLAHFLWQATAIGIVLAVTLRRFSNRSANTRYLIACLAFGLLPVCVAATFSVVHHRGSPISLVAESTDQTCIIRFNSGIQKAELGKVIFPRSGDFDKELDPGTVRLVFCNEKLATTTTATDPPNATAALDVQVVDAETNQPVRGGVAQIRFTSNGWEEKAEDKLISLDKVELTDAGTLTIRIPDQLRGRHSYLQVSIKHHDYVIEQSFGAWPLTPEMSRDSAILQDKLFRNGVIKLKRGHPISGQVLTPDGTPASGVVLYAAWQMPEYLNMPPHAVTDKDGRYKFRVPSRDGYRLFLFPPDAVAVSLPIRKGYGEHPPIKLEAGTAIGGRVLDANGEPLADVVVQGNGSDSVYTGFPNPMVRVKTDAAGRYSLPPMKLPVDVRVAPLGYLGGWSLRGRDLTQDLVFMPKLFKAQGDAPLPQAELDFHPAETVTLTARVYDKAGQPATRCTLAIFGEVPDLQRTPDQRGPFWRGRFRGVPKQPGVFEVKAPKGLVNATLVDAEVPAGPRQKWTRAVREGEHRDGPRTDAGWKTLDRDDDSIVVGEPARGGASIRRDISPDRLVSARAKAGTRAVCTVDDVEFAFRWCPAGEFLMGASTEAKREYGDRFVPQANVQLSAGFWLQETEVTQSQYEMVMGTNPSFWKSNSPSHSTSQHPVEQVSWNEAVTFYQRLSKRDADYDYRLPTEAEWEYACRAGTTTPRYGNLLDIAWVFQNTDEAFQGSSGHRAVGQKQPNAWGLYDMLGNVAEWCLDWYGPRTGRDLADPKGPQTGSSRVVRGDDCFADCSQSMPGCLAAARHSWNPTERSRTIGFRIVRIAATAQKMERDEQKGTDARSTLPVSPVTLHSSLAQER